MHHTSVVHPDMSCQLRNSSLRMMQLLAAAWPPPPKAPETAEVSNPSTLRRLTFTSVCLLGWSACSTMCRKHTRCFLVQSSQTNVQETHAHTHQTYSTAQQQHSKARCDHTHVCTQGGTSNIDSVLGTVISVSPAGWVRPAHISLHPSTTADSGRVLLPSKSLRPGKWANQTGHTPHLYAPHRPPTRRSHRSPTRRSHPPPTHRSHPTHLSVRHQPNRRQPPLFAGQRQAVAQPAHTCTYTHR